MRHLALMLVLLPAGAALAAQPPAKAGPDCAAAPLTFADVAHVDGHSDARALPRPVSVGCDVPVSVAPRFGDTGGATAHRFERVSAPASHTTADDDFVPRRWR